MTLRSSFKYASFSPGGGLLISASWDGTVRLWDVETGQMLNVLEITGSVMSAAFSPDGSLIVSASGDETIRIWERP